jgi:hypothetical protein
MCSAHPIDAAAFGRTARWLGGAVLLVLAGCQAPSEGPPVAAAPGGPSAQVADADDFLIVDCLLPAKVKRLGSRLTYLAARQATRTSGVDCAIRGGEYVAYDRADYKTALAVWQESAEGGDPKAQTYVGQIYERGLGTSADYVQAAAWYERAAGQGYAPAMINLGQLYEQGLGRPKDQLAALNLYRKASGFADAEMTYVVAPDVATEIASLRQQVVVQTSESEGLRKQILGLEDQLAELEQAKVAMGGPLVPAEDWDAQRQEIDAARAALTADRTTQRQQAEDLARQQAALADERAALEAERLQVEADQFALAQAEQRLAAIEQRAAEIGAQASANDARAAELDRREAELGAREQAIELKATPAPAGGDEERHSAVAPGAAAAGGASAAALDQEIEQVRGRLDAARQQLFEMFGDADLALAGPSIKVIEPRLSGARSVATRPSQDGRWQIKAEIEAPAGLLSLALNDQPQTFDGGDGRYVFATNLLAASGDTEVTLVAVDQQGKQADLSFVLKPGEQAAQASSIRPAGGTDPAAELASVQFGSFHALVIGNSTFATLPELGTAVADAEAVADVLQDRYGFTVSLLRNANRAEILSALNDYRLRMTEADNLLIYYAGHCQVDQQTQRGNWLPVDASADSQGTWISNAAITAILETMQARRVLVVADSCYSGTLSGASLTWLDPASSPQTKLAWLRTLVDKRSRTALTSGSLAPVTAPGAKLSAFTEALVTALRENTDVIEGQRLYRAISGQVGPGATPPASELTPRYAPIRYTGHEAGDFFFVPRI